ncbi:tyrosine-type recombinase/integrase [Halomonas litopenaei]|uniref:tyrosine-type recombinase/integrase n=1 Tax=Halomonas litopenaei TaxID=2109328 RepID=UPI001A8EE214|nr:tyrosine-type recombinase/integrase [Halomonas litopenaei]MBN8410736.1 tyrosine-type recombinase/integrase [Halomonas litopenaei]
MKGMPTRWAFKHGAYYYRPRETEREAFDGKAWFRLGASYGEALRAFADRMDVQASDQLSSLIDRYSIEVMPTLSYSAQCSYRQSLDRLRRVMGDNPVGVIVPRVVYRYMDEVATKKTMGVANQDLKVLNRVLDFAVRWGVIDRHPTKGEVKAYGIRDGLRKARDRYIDDWELAAWQSVATRQQRAFAAIILLTGIRKSDCLRIMENHVSDAELSVNVAKTGKSLSFVMTEALSAAVEEARSCKPRPSLYLLPNHRGRCYVNDKGLTQTWDGRWADTMKRALEDTDLEQTFTQHDLRAKVGSDAENDQRAQELLDHTSVSVTRQHYRRKRRAIRPVK